MNEAVSGAFQAVVGDPQVVLIVVLSAIYGIFVGAIPGLTATMAVALMVPLTFFLSDVQAIAAIVTTVTCSIFAGDIPATLVRIPGTPASAAYAADAYALTLQGHYRRALYVALLFSVAGGLLGTLVLAVGAPQLARFATTFTSYEYFWLYVLGLTCATVVSDQSQLKGLFALLLGVLLSLVGLGTDFSQPRLTFGFDQLVSGVNFIPAMIGLFGISEVLRNALRLGGAEQLAEQASVADASTPTLFPFALPFLWRRKLHVVRSSLIGALVGMLPGAGADIAAWISYAVSKRFSREPDKFGSGALDGLGDATGANNAALGAAWIPALVFGIPGDSVTAIGIGVLLMKNITPGPRIFDAAADPARATLAWTVFVTFLLANLVLIPVGLLAVRAGGLLIRIPRATLLPLIVLFCLVGSFAMNASYFDVVVMLVMGVLGFLLERQGVPLGPVVLGIILGGQVEHTFLQCAAKSSSAAAFVSSPVSLILAASSIVLWILPRVWRRRS